LPRLVKDRLVKASRAVDLDRLPDIIGASARNRDSGEPK